MSPEERHHIASAYERGMAVLAEERARRDDSRTLPAPSDAPVEMPLTAPRLPRIVVQPEQHPPPRADARREFIRRELAVTRRFMDRFASADFDGPGASYSREYRCACGFQCSEAGKIFDHCEGCSQ